MRLQQFARETITPRRTRNAGAKNMCLNMCAMRAHHLSRKPQTVGGGLVGMGGQPSLAQMWMGLARPSIAQGFACLSMIARARLQLCFECSRRHQIRRGCAGLFGSFERQPAILSIVFNRQRLCGCRMDDRAAGIYFFAACATARRCKCRC